MVIPGLYIGSQFAAGHRDAIVGISDPDAETRLRNLGITNILCVTNDLPDLYPNTFHYKHIGMSDTATFNLLNRLDETFTYIDTVLKGTGKSIGHNGENATGSAETQSQNNVLVHCQVGMSRSAAVVMAYLMKKKGWTFEYSYKFLKEKRSMVTEKSFGEQLREYQDILGIETETHRVQY
eukprot:CAMPEP_0204865468 /NCGR_PEP_ID=MMETSP1348-20121228/10010_1 /ASSEMBLY_ACC=CAM_ASM_000700 /TAXON_ID=215587 /ORGANISM="Aplanochytrium stocchinoi, Strain GSBS06" /LENGTH=179 /DNA_ID=CAMNT_0052016765 /DNA_START=218 /DNA_END=757 /DNA_ORIENTATION=-